MIFIFAGEENSSNCQMLMNCFLKICDELGVPIADEKLVGPVHVLTFLGLEIDTDEMMVRIPQSKMNAKKQFINIWHLFEFSSPAKIKSSK
jgi:hypothetical protein